MHPVDDLLSLVRDDETDPVARLGQRPALPLEDAGVERGMGGAHVADDVTRGIVRRIGRAERSGHRRTPSTPAQWVNEAGRKSGSGRSVTERTSS